MHTTLKCNACLYNRMVISILIMININYDSLIIINIYMNECIYKLTFHFFVAVMVPSFCKPIAQPTPPSEYLLTLSKNCAMHYSAALPLHLT